MNDSNNIVNNTDTAMYLQDDAPMHSVNDTLTFFERQNDKLYPLRQVLPVITCFKPSQKLLFPCHGQSREVNRIFKINQKTQSHKLEANFSLSF